MKDLKKYIYIPKNIPVNLHKNFRLLVGIDIICLLIHVYMIILFKRLDIVFMQRFNYFSVTWFILLLIFMFCNRSNKWFCASYGIMGEIILHQSLAVIFIGVDSGFQYFILVSAVCFTYFPEKKRYRYIRLGLSAVAIMVFIWLTLRSRKHAPLYFMPDQRLQSLFILCCTLSLGVIMGIMYFSYRANERAFQELADKNQQIVAASDAKVSFLANMSHEIRTPMNAILGMTDLILSENISKTVREKTENIYTASRSLLTIINDILDFSKIESGKMEIIDAEYRLSYILSDIYFLMMPKAETKALSLSVQIDGDVPDRLIGDEIRLKQIILNMVSNAVKYTEKGSITIHVSARPVQTGINLKLSVADTGIGIRALDVDKLFSSFTQVNTRQNRKIEGTGLGLAISKQLITLMCGFMNVESEYGKGSVFSFVLPQKVADPTPMIFDNEKHHAIEDIRTQNIRIYNFVAPKARLLVVDDVDMNRKVALGLLAPYQMQVETASGGLECLEKLRRSQDYDIVFMDHMMPGMDGVDTTKLIRTEEGEYFQKLPVVALTANALNEVKTILLNSGMDDFLTKPIDMHDMYRVLLRWLPKDKILYMNDTQEAETDLQEEQEQCDFEIPGIDIRQGLFYSGGKAQYMEFLGVYCESAAGIVERIREALLEKDWKQIAIDVHALKSTSAGIGAVALSEEAKEMEKAVDEDMEFVQSHMPDLLLHTESLLQSIQEALPKHHTTQNRDKGILSEKLIPELECLAASIEDFMPDTKRLLSLLEMDCEDFPEYRDFILEVQKAIDRFDYDKAASRMASLLSSMKERSANGEN